MQSFKADRQQARSSHGAADSPDPPLPTVDVAAVVREAVTSARSLAELAHLVEVRDQLAALPASVALSLTQVAELLNTTPLLVLRLQHDRKLPNIVTSASVITYIDTLVPRQE